MDDPTLARLRAAWDRELGAPGPVVADGSSDAAEVLVHDGRARVRVPAAWQAEVEDAVPAAAPDDLLSPTWWAAALPSRHLTTTGPAVLGVRDHWDDGPQPALVEQVPPWRLGGLQREVDDAGWAASGLAGDVVVAFARFAEPLEPSPFAHRVTEAARRTVVSAAASLTAWDGDPVDVGVVVAPGYRRRGHGLAVAAAATRFAVTEHGLALWRVHESDAAAVALGSRLGFEPVARGLVVRAR